MNLVFLIGVVLLGSLSEPDLSPCEESFANDHQPCLFTPESQDARKFLASLDFESLEDPFDLGFNTADYLPEDFDPTVAYVNLNSFELMGMEEEEPVIGGALPEGFNPYAQPENFMDISYIDLDKEEELIYPEIDTAAWLPEDFDAYSRKYIVVAEKFNEQLVLIKATLASAK